MYKIPFNKPVLVDKHFEYLRQALDQDYIAGDGRFAKQCEELLGASAGGVTVRLVTSATHALEMMALLLRIEPGDEVIVPSYSFVSTANAFALRGARIRFADNDMDGNILPSEVERLLSPRTRAVIALHYAGASCDLDRVLELCASHQVPLLEDAAQAIGATFNGRALGTIGTLGCYSFHETKNITSGEGGALIFGNKEYLERAEILREKGTDRSRFLQGLVDKYTWVDLGSSYVISDLNAAYLYPQLLTLPAIIGRRREIHGRYTQELGAELAQREIRILETPRYNTPNYHMMALVMPSNALRDAFIAFMNSKTICCPFHYVSLHTSPFGSRYYDGPPDRLPGAERIASCLVRLPLYYNMTEAEQARVIDAVGDWIMAL